MRSCSILLLLSLVTVVSIEKTDGAKILALFSLNGRSHFVMFESLLKGLAERGHQVHVVGFFPQKKPVPNYTDINLERALPGLVNNFTVDFVRGFGYIKMWEYFWYNCYDMCVTVLEQPEMKKIISGEEKYDLIITEIFGVDCFLGLAHKLRTPFISMISSVAFPWSNDRIGNPDNPSYIPSYFLSYTDHMNFVQRVINSIFTEGLKLGSHFLSDLKMDKLGKKYYGEDLPPLSELQKKTSLILVNSHFSLNIPRPAVPAFVEVGGLHIRSGGKLPQDIQTFMDGAKNGVVYFSLGSLVRGETLPKETLNMLISVFSELPQRVLWKIDYPGQLPSNIKTSKWLPQFEILSHPNVRAFMSHGGLMGTQEAVYTGVPIIGMPLFADQEMNIRNCMSKGMAELVYYDEISRETITNALDKVLNDPSYMKNAKQLSRLFRDRPLSALDTAIFWTEYVIRHGGAPHMRTAAVELPLYQYLLLDVIAVISLVVLSVCATIYLISRKLYSLCCGRSGKKLKSS